jgi:hypothetical protein
MCIVQCAPMQCAPVQCAPVQGAPVQGAPVQCALCNEHLLTYKIIDTAYSVYTQSHRGRGQAKINQPPLKGAQV